MDTDTSHDTLFDLLQTGPPNTVWLALGALALVLALAQLVRQRRQGRPWGVAAFFVLGSGLMVAATVLSIVDHHRLVTALRAGRVQVVEGPLQSYNVQHRAHYNPSSKRYDRSIAESFYVGPVPFGYVRDTSVPGFTNSGRAAIQFHDGQVLRVHYVEDTPGDFNSRRIVRLERLPVRLAGESW